MSLGRSRLNDYYYIPTDHRFVSTPWGIQGITYVYDIEEVINEL